MKLIKLIVLLFCLQSLLVSKVVDINSDTKSVEILSSSKVYIDTTRSLQLKEIKKLQFSQNNEDILSYGYSPDLDVWIKFTLKNTSNTTLKKILEYGSSLTTNIELFSGSDSYKEGLFDINNNRRSLNPIFEISLQPQEKKTYYLKASSKITTLIVKLKIWKEKEFYGKEIRNQVILGLFFGAMTVLAIYNIFIYFYTRDISYLYYVMYIAGIIIHHLLYIGFAFIYLLDSAMISFIVSSSPWIITFPILSLGLFTRSFLKLKRDKLENRVLDYLLIALVISVVIVTVSSQLYPFRNLVPVAAAVYLIFLTVFNSFKGNRQAYFILAGWMIIFFAIVVMNLSSMGIFNIFTTFPYIIEVAFVLEAIIFSIALADRIKQLQVEKDQMNKELIKQQSNAQIRLKEQVIKQTKHLKQALNEKGTLLKELNHRVKNNIQMVISLLRLQSDDIEEERLKDIFLTAQNRLSSMSHLHEILYKQESVSYIDAYEYFDAIIFEILESYEDLVKVSCYTDVKLKMEQAVYCGLIINELVTNSLKYAFTDKNQGEIRIELTKKGGKHLLIVSDNGVGCDMSNTKNTLGISLVRTLVKNQLKGDLEFLSEKGLTITIVWDESE